MLRNIRILDLTQYLPGPFATNRLVQLGAEVIKVESPKGDLARTMTGRETSPIFTAMNRHKRSLVLNLKEKDDVEKFYNLVKTADIVIESFRPSVAKRLKIDYDSLLPYKKDLIYCSLSGYGQKGRLSSHGSHDLNYMALSSVLSQMKDESGKPVHPTLTFADLIGGMYANEAILAALLRRERAEKGVYLDLSLVDPLLSFMQVHQEVYKEENKLHGLSDINGTIINYYIYQTKDKRYVALGALEKKFWNNFCEAVEKEEWKKAYYSKATQTNPTFLEVQSLFHSKTLEEWATVGLLNDCCLTPILEVNELNTYPLFADRNSIMNKSGDIYYYSYPFLKEQRVVSKPPKMGEFSFE